jgi:hypothetical protein
MREYLKEKIKKLATCNKNKNIRDMYRGTNKFRKGYQHRTWLRMKRVICLQIPTFGTGGRTTTLSE